MPPRLHRSVVLAFTAMIASLAPCPAILYAQSPQIERIEIFDLGIYCAETIDKVRQPGAPGGYVNLITEPRLLKRTTLIPLQLGTRFGMRYTVVGTPAAASVDIRLITKFPSPGLRNPSSGETMMVSDYTIPGRVGATGMRGTHLEFDWELLPGTWTFEFWSKERKLAAQGFALAKATPARRWYWGGASCAPLLSGLTRPKFTAGNESMIPKSGTRFSDKIMLKQKARPRSDSI